MTPEQVFAETRVASPSLVPELALHLLTADSQLWFSTEPDVLGWPYWAIAWPGGQALARYVLDNPECVRGKRVLSFGSGGGLEAIAALRAGASSALCADVDPFANEVARRNAALNGVSIHTTSDDLIGRGLPAIDVVLAGDVTYEPTFAGRVLGWLLSSEDHVSVLLGDAGRVPIPRFDVLATWRAPFDGDVRALTTWNTRVLRVK